MAYLTSNDGKKIWYDVVGEGEPLVLIGGSSLVHNQWDFMLPILQDHFKVILYDQRGAGLSDRSPAGISVEQWVDDLKMILDEIGVEKTHIFGTSNGSLVVIRFAAKYPERTGAIIHYGIYRFTDQYKKMSGIGAKIVDEFVPKIKAPQLIVIGGGGPLGKDTDYASGSGGFQRLWPDIRVVVIGGAEGTFHVITHPEEVAREVIEFFKKHRIGM